MQTPQPTLISQAWPASEQSKWIRMVVLAFVGTLLIAIASKIKVPFYPVPMTMQTFVILGIGMAYGWRLGGATVLLYLGEGAIGLPVFTGTPEKGIGLVYMMGGTGGYLFGYLLAVLAVGWLAERGWDRNLMTTAAAMLAGNILIFAPGLLWLGMLFGWDKPILDWGLWPFVGAEVFKIALATCLMPLAWMALGRKGGDAST